MARRRRVANETQGAQVHFDDLTVSVLGFEITEMTDYYPFGSVLTQWTKPQEKDYMFGYQGQFAEEDKETGFNHFELRDYDPVIGRWMNVDPYGQYASLYIGMGNDPVNGVDPDGGFKSKFWANVNAFFTGGEVDYASDKGEYYVGHEAYNNNLGVAYTRNSGVYSLQIQGEVTSNMSFGAQVFGNAFNFIGAEVNGGLLISLIVRMALHLILLMEFSLKELIMQDHIGIQEVM